MKFKSNGLFVPLITVALMISALSARASTVSISGEAGWAEASDYFVSISGPGLALGVGTCDAPEQQDWSGPFTFSAGSEGPDCTAGGASYESFSWTASYFGSGPYPAPDDIDAGITGTPSECGSMIVNPNDTWSETCAASISGSFEALPRPGTGPGPVLSGTITGSGSVTFSGIMPEANYYEVFDFSTTFTGTADVVSPVPEPGSLSLIVVGVITLLGLAVRRA
jgi:hypothetical protein